MSLTLATLLPGILLVILGALLLSGNSTVTAMFKALPRSRTAAFVFFGVGAAWFLYHVSHLSEADFGTYRTQLFIGFAVVAGLSFFYVTDFLAVRGLAVLMLLAASPLLYVAYGEYDHPQRLFMVTLVYIGIGLAIYLGAVPYRLRDFFQWLFAQPARAKVLGGACFGYGLLLSVVAFTY